MTNSIGLGCQFGLPLEYCPNLFLSAKTIKSLSTDFFAYLLLFTMSFYCIILPCLLYFKLFLMLNCSCLNLNQHLSNISTLKDTLQYSSLTNLLCLSHLKKF